MKKIVLLLCLLPFINSAQQASLKKAEKYYNSYNYSKVIERLEGKKDLSTTLKRELAESYRMTGQYAKAEENYASLITLADKDPGDVLAYAQVLKINGKYTEAMQQLDQYSTLKSSELRVMLLNKNKNYLEELLKDKGQFTIKNLEMNTAEEDFGVAYFKDKVVFTSSRNVIGAAQRKWNGNNLNFLDLYLGAADSVGEIKDFKRLSDVNKKYHEGPASYNKKGNIAFFTVDNYKEPSSDGVRKLELYESKFENDKWSKLNPFPLNNKEYSVGHPSLSEGGNILYFASDMPGGKGGVDLYRITRNPDGNWGQPENLGDKINTEGNEMFPYIHENGMFFFSSDGHPGLGGLDVFAAQMINDAPGKVVNLGAPVNSSRDDFSFVLNHEQTGGYFASNREGGKGNDDIYSYKVLKPFVFGKVIKGVAKDQEGNILAGTAVSLMDEKGSVIKTAVTQDDGAYSFDVDENHDFKLNGAKEKYFDGNNTANTRGEEAVVVADLVLAKDPGFSLFALVTDHKTGQILEGVKMKITDAQGEVVNFVTPASGDYRTPIANKKIGDRVTYKFELSKDGYISKTIEFSSVLNKPGEVKVHDALDLSLGRMELGTDVGKLVNIKPIYFDVNKFNIRPDAAVELDKIVKVMNEYPAMVIELGSHTDCRAPKAYNLNLSDKRAKASAAYIVSKGITKDRIYGKGYGESRLKNGCACEGNQKSTCTEEEHQQNRRTEFIIVKLKD